MKITIPTLITLIPSLPLIAHDLSAPNDNHSHSDSKPLQTETNKVEEPKDTPPQAAPFSAFAPAVKTRWDENFLFIESTGLPAHNMMVGITNWQQQVPIPQDYTGENSWRIPLNPVPAEEPKSIQGAFLRGAIAIAVNGIPIFNPQNNRGEVAQDIGELDQWGGHCGRADDYHYHAAPLHLQAAVGPDSPIAYALDGYPIYGLTEVDGSEPEELDEFNGHSKPELGYHYHASKKYPFVHGGFHGEVTERDGQVDPQPRAQPLRDALPPLRGAEITGFERNEDFDKLTYTVKDETRFIAYRQLPDGDFEFIFDSGTDGTKKGVYTRQEGGGPPQDGPPPQVPRPAGEEAKTQPSDLDEPALVRKRSSDGTFLLASPVVEEKGELPLKFTGDGEGISPPVTWKGSPEGTASFVLIMDHVDREGVWKWSWTVYDIQQRPQPSKRTLRM